MERCRAPAAVKPADHGDAGDDPDELGVFAAERYFYGDDALLWCERSSSSLSSAFRTGTIEHDRSVPTPTAATSSSEASWNSRSALLPSEPAADEKLRAVAGAGTTPVAEAEPSGAESERAGHRRASSSSLRRWLLGVVGCACVGGDGDESVSADEMEDSNDVHGVGGKKCDTESGKLFPQREMIPEPAFEEATAVRPGSGRWLLEGDKVLAVFGGEAFSPIEIAGHCHRRAANSGELPAPVILHPAPTATSDERRRVKSLEMFRPLGDQIGSAMQNSAFTVVAGNAAPSGAPRAAAGSGGSHGTEDDAPPTPSELGCAYPPSEASVVWSVVTADGAASGNFSSAASGYYYHYFDCGEDSTLRHAAGKSDRRRRSGGITTATSSLLTCMSEKAVDAVGPAQSVHRPEAELAAAGRQLGASGGSRNGHGGGYQDVVRRRVGR